MSNTFSLSVLMTYEIYNGQQRPLTSKITPNIRFRMCLDFVFRKSITIWFGLHNPDQEYFWFFSRCARNRYGEKSNSLRFLV